jgi:thiol-disulfide isomerase/thioredoxin
MKILMFTAKWCSTCQQQKPMVDIYSANMDIEIEFIDVQTEYGLELANFYKVRGLPTYIQVNGTIEISRSVGKIPDILLSN